MYSTYKKLRALNFIKKQCWRNLDNDPIGNSRRFNSTLVQNTINLKFECRMTNKK